LQVSKGGDKVKIPLGVFHQILLLILTAMN